MQQFLSKTLQLIQSLEIQPKNILEIVILAVAAYYIFLWIKNSRTGFLLRGIGVILAFFVIASILELNVILFIAEKSLSVLVIALLIIFQPELRAALEQLGQRNYIMNLFSSGRMKEDSARHSRAVTDELVKASYAMAKAKTGALIVIERQIPLEEYVKTGIPLDALVSGGLLINIFEKNTPLHDGAVILKGNRVVAATCYLPLSTNMEISKNLGTRHRAAIGVSEETDSLTIVVSEETGAVSLAMGGTLKHNLSPDELKKELLVLEQEPEAVFKSIFTPGTSRKKKNKKDRKAEEAETALTEEGTEEKTAEEGESCHDEKTAE